MKRITKHTLSVIALMSVAAGSTQTGYAQYVSPFEHEEVADGPAPARDLTGVWGRIVPEGTFRDRATWTPDPPALTAWGQERFAAARSSNADEFALSETNDPVLTRCYPPGVPRVYMHPYPFEIAYTATQMLMLYEYDHMIRRVFMDGRPLPEDPVALWLGTSVGEWADDTTFVVTTVGIDERTWLDRSGVQHSDQLKVTETFRRIDKRNLEIDIVMEDPIALAQPWRTETLYYRLAPPSWELSEISCSGDYLEFSDFEGFLEGDAE